MPDIIDLNSKRKPVVYTVEITHHWDDSLEVFIYDVSDSERSRASVTESICRVADLIREGKLT